MSNIFFPVGAKYFLEGASPHLRPSWSRAWLNVLHTVDTLMLQKLTLKIRKFTYVPQDNRSGT